MYTKQKIQVNQLTNKGYFVQYSVHTTELFYGTQYVAEAVSPYDRILSYYDRII